MKKLFPYLLSAACLYACWLLGIAFLYLLALYFHYPLPGNATHFVMVPLLGLQIPISSFIQYSFWCAAFGWLLVGVPLVFFREKISLVFDPKFSFICGAILSVAFLSVALHFYPYPGAQNGIAPVLGYGLYGLLNGNHQEFSYIFLGVLYILLGIIVTLLKIECLVPALIGGLSLWSFSWLYHQEKLFLRLSRSIPFYCISLSILLGSTLLLYWYGGFPIVGHLTGLWPGAWAKGQMMLYFSDLRPPSR